MLNFWVKTKGFEFCASPKSHEIAGLCHKK